MAKPLCIYHANCLDGFSSAHIVHRHTGADLKSFKYGDALDMTLVKNREKVYIVDFSFPADVLREMAQYVESITLIDHHENAASLIAAGLPDNIELVLDCSNEQFSGVGLVWRYFNHTLRAEVMPMLYQHVQDRDIWKFRLEHTKAICAAMFTYKQTIPNWDMMLHNTGALLTEGYALVRKQEKEVAGLVGTAYKSRFDGLLVPFCNAPWMFASDVGNELCKDSLFAVIWYQSKDGIHVSLRSHHTHGVNVAEIAKKFGGGGHRNAAGCLLTFNEFIEAQEIDGG